ncbi:hypothetical protein DSO57_1031182 [Entomophthora muscae]|uniref:Uncharacterized protein n=1 Tax=Entomophthora muscae TaxID=34485 RepID=A0ACC2SDD1_9FUNG|nr:hypothetical protein DSO57_1031182 [Entomophthora muscae]
MPDGQLNLPTSCSKSLTRRDINFLPDLLSCHPTTADSSPEYKCLNTKAVLPASVFINQIFLTLFNFPDTYFIQKAQSEDPATNKIIQYLLSKAMPPSEYSLENNLFFFFKLVMVPNKTCSGKSQLVSTTPSLPDT